MIRFHARYEALAGALLLGEATDSERAEYAAHAAQCAACPGLLECDTTVTAHLARARDAETWRPALAEGLLARIRERHARRWRFAVGAVSYGAAFVVVLNVAVVSGFTDRVGRALWNRSYATLPAVRLAPSVDASSLLFASTRKSAPPEHVARKLRHHAAGRSRQGREVTARN